MGIGGFRDKKKYGMVRPENRASFVGRCDIRERQITLSCTHCGNSDRDGNAEAL